MVSICSVLTFASAVGFSGSRSICAAQYNEVSSAIACLSPSAVVSVGCARGVDELVRQLVPSAMVFRVADMGFAGRGAFAARSIACVRSVAAAGDGVWVSSPSLDSPCPSGLVPSASSSACFSGQGSGTWASLAFAAGLGVRCLMFWPASFPLPVGWSFIPLAGSPGWFDVSPMAVQLSLFGS